MDLSEDDSENSEKDNGDENGNGKLYLIIFI